MIPSMALGKVRLSLLFGVVVYVFGVIGSPMKTKAQDSPELLEYISKVRKYGMSEEAPSVVGGVARVRLGYTLIEFRRDPQSQRYWPGYTTTTCPNHYADQEELAKWRAEVEEKSETETTALRLFADMDSSGFVTTAEAWSFRGIFEFGIPVAEVAKLEGYSIRNISAASGLDSLSVEGKLEEYRLIARMIEGQGLRPFPAIPRR
jgi:hypothetical protein